MCKVIAVVRYALVHRSVECMHEVGTVVRCARWCRWAERCSVNIRAEHSDARCTLVWMGIGVRNACTS